MKGGVSVVMPCLNEAATLEAAILNAREFLARESTAGEIVVADNGSDDGSREIARAAGARVVEVARRGYGAALRGGIEAADGDVIVMGDADTTYDFNEASRLVEDLRSGADFAIGSRLRGRIECGAMPFLHRHLGTPVLSGLIRILYGVEVSDCNCGLRAFTAAAYRRMGLGTDGMEFASEMICSAARAGLRIAEEPVTLRQAKAARRAHVRSVRDALRHLRVIFGLIGKEAVYEKN